MGETEMTAPLTFAYLCLRSETVFTSPLLVLVVFVENEFALS